MIDYRQPYRVYETNCFPARWKVGRSASDDNDTRNYFREREDAEIEAKARNINLPAND